MPKQQGNEDERVLRPLVQSDGPQPTLQDGGAIFERFDWHDAGFSERCTQFWERIGDHRRPASCQKNSVRWRIADIAEFVAEALAKGSQLVSACEIGCSIRRHYAVEDSDMSGNSFGQRCVGGGCEKKMATGSMLQAEPLQKGTVVGKVLDVKTYSSTEMAFEFGFTLCDPTGNLKYLTGVLTRQSEHAVDESVRFDQRSIEIDTNWHGGFREPCRSAVVARQLGQA